MISFVVREFLRKIERYFKKGGFSNNVKEKSFNFGFYNHFFV